MRSLSSVAVRNLTRRKGRYVLTASGIALGVAVLFAVQIMSGATTSALDRAVKGAAGKADVGIGPVGNFDATLAPDALARVKALPDVVEAIPSSGFRTSVAKPGDNTTHIAFVSGIDIGLDRTVRSYEVRTGHLFAPGAAEVVLGRHLAQVAGVRVGDDVALAAPSGAVTLKLVGVLADTGAGTANGGDIAYTSLPVTQRIIGKGPLLTGIDVVLRDGVDPDRWIKAERAALGDNVSMARADSADAGFRSFVNAVNGALTLGSVIALFVGGFLIFLTFSLAVAERTRTYGTMRALGALPKQVRRTVVTEAAVLGFVSSLAGLILGYGLAAAAMKLVSSLLFLRLPGLGLPVAAALVSVVVGVIVSVVAAWLPGRRAAALSPVAAMRAGGLRDEKAGRPLIGTALVVVGIALVLATPSSGARIFPTLMVLFGAVLLVPIVLKPLAGLLGRLTQRIARGVGAVAVMHLVRERSRSAYTLALVMVVLAMVFATATSNVSMSHTVDKVVERQAGGAIQVGAPGAFDPGVDKQLAAVKDVKAVSALRFGQIDLLGGDAQPRQFFSVVDPATYFSIASFAWLTGDDAAAKAAFAKGGAIALPEQQANRLNAKRGGTVAVRTSQGVRRLNLVGTFAQLGNFPGPVVSIADAALFGAGRPNAFLVSLRAGADAEVVRHAILTALQSHPGIQVQTSTAIKRQAHAQLQGFFALAYALLFVAALVGVLGLANTMVVAVLARTREVGMLRSTGTLRRQARAMVLVEASTLALVAYLLSLPLGWLLSAGIVVSQRATLGFSIDYVFPWVLIPALAITAVGVAAIASLLPARRVGRLQVVEALRFD